MLQNKKLKLFVDLPLHSQKKESYLEKATHLKVRRLFKPQTLLLLPISNK